MDEMTGLADAAGSPVGDIILYNIFYELFSACTSIVARDKEHSCKTVKFWRKNIFEKIFFFGIEKVDTFVKNFATLAKRVV